MSPKTKKILKWTAIGAVVTLGVAAFVVGCVFTGGGLAAGVGAGVGMAALIAGHGSLIGGLCILGGVTVSAVGVGLGIQESGLAKRKPRPRMRPGLDGEWREEKKSKKKSEITKETTIGEFLKANKSSTLHVAQGVTDPQHSTQAVLAASVKREENAGVRIGRNIDNDEKQDDKQKKRINFALPEKAKPMEPEQSGEKRKGAVTEQEIEELKKNRQASRDANVVETITLGRRKR